MFGSSFKIYRQHDAMQCGIACLQMVCHHYGRNYTLDALSHLCGATTQGVSLLGISDAAGRLGLQTVSGRVSLEMLGKATLPCILHWNQNHFVILYCISHKGMRYHIADPARGLVEYTQQQFVDHWVGTHSCGEEKGIAMFLEPTPAFFDCGCEDDASSETSKRSFGYLARYVWMYRKYFVQIGAGLILGSLMQLILPFLTQSIVDVGIRNHDIGFVWLVLIGQLMLTFSSTVVDFIRRWLLLHINMRVNISLVSDFLVKLMRLPMSFFDTKQMGDILQRMGDHGRVNSFLTQQTLGIMFSMITLVVFSVVLFWYNVLIFVIFCVGGVLYGLWLASFLQRRKQIDYDVFECQAENSNKTYELVTSMQEIKLQGCQQRRRWEWEDVQAKLFGVQIKSLRLQQTQEAGSIFINEVKNIVITIVAATAVINGDMTLGMMLAVQYIIGQLGQPIEQLMSFVYSLQDVRISLERINEIYTIDDEDKNCGNRCRYDDDNKGIDITEACFKYDRHALHNTIDGVSISIPHGKVTAIVGASGSGKTTLVKLMLGYYPLLSGKISVGGTMLNDLNPIWWRSQCGAVMQEGVIFSETIARNIAVADGEIDTKRLAEAAHIACIDGFVESLPLKYNTKIGRDGMGLSQGQKQRLLIARAVYRSPDFIFLDEATNSLDAQNERQIVENLADFYCGRTVVVVAHRLSTVRDADQIVVMEGGRVVETGTHATLVEQRGVYYTLVKNQLELGC